MSKPYFHIVRKLSPPENHNPKLVCETRRLREQDEIDRVNHLRADLLALANLSEAQ